MWRSNPSRNCSQERLTRGTATSTMRKTAHPPECARCGAGAGRSSIKYQSLYSTLHVSYWDIALTGKDQHQGSLMIDTSRRNLVETLRTNTTRRWLFGNKTPFSLPLFSKRAREEEHTWKSRRRDRRYRLHRTTPAPGQTPAGQSAHIIILSDQTAYIIDFRGQTAHTIDFRGQTAHIINLRGQQPTSLTSWVKQPTSLVSGIKSPHHQGVKQPTSLTSEVKQPTPLTSGVNSPHL